MRTTNQTGLGKYWKLSFGLTTLVLFSFGTTVAQESDSATTEGAEHKVMPYTVTDLGTLGGTFSIGAGINNKGRVVGFGSLPGDTNHHDFLWRKGVKIDLGTLGGPNSDEFNFGGPNERGQVVGDAETNASDPLGEDFCSEGTHLICLPFLWQDGVMSPLPTLGGNNGVAADINNRGQVVGFAENTTLESTCPTPRLQWRPFLWEKGEIQELPTFPGDPVGGALAINDKGQAVGDSGACLLGHSSSGLHALLWQNGTLTDLGNLGGTFSIFALDINNQGQVVGVSDLPGDTTSHAFLWQNGTMTDLGTLPGDFFSTAISINNGGQAVGGSFDASGNCRSFLWQDGVMTDLNSLIPAGSPMHLCFANDVNDRGEIVGGAFVTAGPHAGEFHGFLATPSNGEAAGQSLAPDGHGETTQTPKIPLPESVRNVLQQRRGFGRFGAWPVRPQ